MSETEYLKSNVFQCGESERKLSIDYIIIYFFYVWISSLNQMHILYNFKKNIQKKVIKSLLCCLKHWDL